MDSLMAAVAFPQHDRRQIPGLGAGATVTPEMLAQINLADKSVVTPWVWGINLTAIVLIAVVVTTRLSVRHFMVHQFFADDYLIIVAVLCTFILCAVSLAAIRYGFGQHVWNLDIDTLLDDVKRCIQLMFVGNVSYACAIAFTKFSIMASYLRIFPDKTLRYCMIACAIVTAGLFLASVPATLFQCKPINAAWDFSITDATCYPFTHFLYASTAINIATDLALCLTPLPFFWKLQLPLKQRILVSCLFVIGGFACVASIIRISFLGKLVGGIDVTYNLVASVLWTLAECAIGIICVSIPTIRPLFAKMAPKIFGTQRTRGGPATGGKGRVYALIELERKAVAAGANGTWAFSRLGSNRGDRVWDGSDISGHALVSISARPTDDGYSQASKSLDRRGTQR